MEEKIIRLTKSLIHYNQMFLNNYEAARTDQVTSDFDLVVKPFANEIKQINDEWNPALKKWLLEKKLKHFNTNQVDSVSEHIEKLSIQSFYPETSRSRFMHSFKTTEFFLMGILTELTKLTK